MNYNLAETFILGFHELQLHAIARVEKLWDEIHVHVRIENQLGFCDLFKSYDMEVETHMYMYKSKTN